MSSSVLLQKLEPMIRKSMNPKNIKSIAELITQYLDDNIEKLTTAGPVYKTIFMEHEYVGLYNILDISELEIRSIINESKYIRGQWQIMNNPFNSVATLCIRHFIATKNEEMERMMVIYFTLSFYPSLFNKYFKYEPNKAIMDYTISNLSGQYKVRQTETFYHALIDTSFVCTNTYRNNLLAGSDKDIVDYVHAIKTRLNAMIKNVAIEFYKNEKEGAYLNETEDSNEEDNFRKSENDSIIIEKVANSVIMKLATNGPDMQLVTISAKSCNISVNELRNVANNMCADNSNREDITFIVSSLIYAFIFEEHKEKSLVGSRDFYYYCIGLFIRPNSISGNIVKIRTIIDAWLTKYSAHYSRSNRIGTINNFKRALYSFIVFTIQRTAKEV